VEGIFMASVKDGLSGEVINLGNPQEFRIIDIAKLIIELTNSNSQIVFYPPLPDDPKRRCPDISKAKRLLSWEPKKPLREGLLETINWFRKKLKDA
ncbi:MAG: SDR family NAD-dependent epimerase/dehydratase, partial [Hydrogenobacter sp.]